MPKQRLSTDNIAILKTATRRLVRAAGGVESAASATRVGKSILSDYQNPALTDHFMPIDVAAELEGDTGTDHVTQAMCRLAGGYFVRNKAGNIVDFSAHMPELGKSIGEVWSQTAVALADGKISDSERHDLINRLDDSIAVMISARNALGGE